MKSYLQPSALAIALFTFNDVYAFPNILDAAMTNAAKRQAGSDLPAPPGDPGAALLGFEATKQYVSNTGDHAFNPPGPGDKRGPCPGKLSRSAVSCLRY